MDSQLLETKIKALSLLPESSTTSSSYQGNSSCYYNLDELKDNECLEKLQKERLNHVLQQFQKEREDTSFSRSCLFCKKHFSGNRSILFAHLIDQHNFHVGAPDNIVFGNELFDVLEDMLKNLKCFYCEKTFKDWMTLKEHMRKKQHKQINPKNQTYDKFYIINYLELGKSWTEVQCEDDEYSQESDDNDAEQMEWQDENLSCVCLFCKTTHINLEKIFCHMKEDHQFDFDFIKATYHLDFYKQVKLINYIRRRVLELKCTFCDLQFMSHCELMKHISETRHVSTLPDSTKWDQSMYFFSTFENDNLLCSLNDDDNESHESLVFPEETPYPCSTLLNDENFRRTLV